jgi:hypothetical protein
LAAAVEGTRNRWRPKRLRITAAVNGLGFRIPLGRARTSWGEALDPGAVLRMTRQANGTAPASRLARGHEHVYRWQASPVTLPGRSQEIRRTRRFCAFQPMSIRWRFGRRGGQYAVMQGGHSAGPRRWPESRHSE